MFYVNQRQTYDIFSFFFFFYSRIYSIVQLSDKENPSEIDGESEQLASKQRLQSLPKQQNTATADSDSPTEQLKTLQQQQQSDATQAQSNKIAAETNFVFYPETNFANASDTQTEEHELETRLK